MMRPEKEIENEIKKLKRDYNHVLEGSRATIYVNAPRALMQVSVESKLTALYWALGREYKSALRGTNT